MKTGKHYWLILFLGVFLITGSQGLKAQMLPGPGYALDFDGADSVSLPNAYSRMTLPISIAVWFKPNVSGGNHAIFMSSDIVPTYQGWWLEYANNDLKIAFGDGNGGGSTAFSRVGSATIGPLDSTRWYHFAAVVRSATDMDIYLNGNSQTVNYAGTGGTSIATNSSGGVIGQNPQNNFALNAQLDEMSIWSTDLSTSEVRDLMCAKLTGTEPSLEGYYQFDALSGSTLSDAANNGNDGTVNGARWAPSKAPIGDRSFYAYNTTVVNGNSLSGDTASATVQGNGAPGIHLYFVDQKPIPQPQVTSGGMPSAANFYVGVFAADYNRNYGFTLAPNPNTYQPNTLGLAHRPHNAATSWAGLTALNNPVISINSRPAPEQLALVDRCPTPNLLPDTARCDSVRLVVTGPYDQFIWSNNDTGNTRWVTQSGKVWVQARDTTNGCTVVDTAQVNIIDPATTSLFPDDTLVCNSDFIELSATLPGVLSYQWSNGQTDSIARFFNPDTFWLKLFLPGGCTVADTIVVNFSEDIEPMVIERRTLCAGEEITVDIDPLEFVRVTWSTGSTDFSETFNTPGTYGVAAEKPDGCIEYDSLYLLPPPGTDSAQVYSDTTFCAADGGIRLLPPDSFDVRWPNNSDSLFIVNQTQVVRAEISDSCTNWVEFFSVNKVDCGCQVKIPNAFTPNGDGLNEVFRPIGTCEYTDYNLVIFNRWGIKIFETNEIGAGFDGKLNEEVLPQGAYMYRFTYETESVENRLTGSFQLLR